MTFDSQAGCATAAFDQENSAALARGLHQAAQPLTALQGWLELALLGSHTEAEYKSSIRQAIEESNRVLTCFNRLRELARLPDSAPSISGVAVSALVSAVLERFESDFEAAGVDVVFHPLPDRSGVDDRVRASESRVATVLSLILSSSFPFLASGDRLELAMTSLPETVEIYVLARKQNPASGAWRQELHGSAPLELAHALMLGIGGMVTLGQPAFSVRILLPKMPAMSRSCGSAETRCAHV
ncbi:MAG TPA: hypothetical protein VEK33_07095 [Terriglobales bacterium]|nr:hypothetical protein [Terriglobales bacterium]